MPSSHGSHRLRNRRLRSVSANSSSAYWGIERLILSESVSTLENMILSRTVVISPTAYRQGPVLQGRFLEGRKRRICWKSIGLVVLTEPRMVRKTG